MGAVSRATVLALIFLVNGCVAESRAVDNRFQPWPRDREAMTLAQMTNAGLTRIFEVVSVDPIDPGAHPVPATYRGHRWDQLRIVHIVPLGGDPTHINIVVFPSWFEVATGDSVALLVVSFEFAPFPYAIELASRFEIPLSSDEDVTAAQAVIDSGPQHEFSLFEDEVPLPDAAGSEYPLNLINRFIVE